MEPFRFTPRDRLVRAWQNSMELTRDFEGYSGELDDEELSKVFAEFAEEEAVHAAKLRELIRRYEQNE
ncbi:MAG: rubrerythrin [Clostridia bacterium]|nr:rubrerythrin [Clostridia bacterium]